MCKARLAEKGDLVQVVELLDNVTLKLQEKNINQWVYPWNSDEIDADIKKRNLYIILKDGDIIGTFSLKDMDINSVIHISEADDLYLYRIAISPEYQGQSIGNKAIEYALQVSKQLGKRVYLDC